MDKHLKDLPEETENKLRGLEKICLEMLDPKNKFNCGLTKTNIYLYYSSAKSLYDAGLDSRHHLAVAYSLIKKLKGGNNKNGNYNS